MIWGISAYFIIGIIVCFGLALRQAVQGDEVGSDNTLFPLHEPTLLFILLPFWPVLAIAAIFQKPSGEYHLCNEDEIEANERRKELEGKTGVVKTELRPSGTIEIEGQVHPALSLGPILEVGTPIKVIKQDSLTLGVMKIESPEATKKIMSPNKTITLHARFILEAVPYEEIVQWAEHRLADGESSRLLAIVAGYTKEEIHRDLTSFREDVNRLFREFNPETPSKNEAIVIYAEHLCCGITQGYLEPKTAHLELYQLWSESNYNHKNNHIKELKPFIDLSDSMDLISMGEHPITAGLTNQNYIEILKRESETYLRNSMEQVASEKPTTFSHSSDTSPSETSSGELARG